MTQALAQRTVAKWKRLLGLDGWTVCVEAVHPQTMEAAASCMTTDARQIAHIRIASPPHGRDDAEALIVHELLHLYFPLNTVKDDSYEYVRAEQGIDHVANLLVRMDRECRNPPSNGSRIKSTRKRPTGKRRSRGQTRSTAKGR